MTTDSEPDEEVVTLAEFAASFGREAGDTLLPGLPREDLVLVDGDDRVLASFAHLVYGRTALNKRIDQDPSALSLRLLRIVNGQVEYQDWPRRGTPAERACALARRLHGGSPAGLVETVRGVYLRGRLGELKLAEETRRVLELWWFTPSGEHEDVGLLVENTAGGWDAHIHNDARGLATKEVDNRIAEAMEDLLPGLAWESQSVGALRACIDDDAGYACGALASHLALFALDVARRLSVTKTSEDDGDD